MNIPIIFLILMLMLKTQSTRADCDIPSATTTSGTVRKPSQKLCSGDLIFEDQFDSFDVSTWQHEITLSGCGNGEFQYYRNSRSNSYTLDGKLHIKPTYLVDDYGQDFLCSGTLNITAECTNPDNNGCLRTGTTDNILNPIESARIRTLESFSFKYGTIVARAKIPAGDWLWPAIWLLPTDWKYGSWPISGEIDVMESRGNRDLTDSSGRNLGSQLAFSTLHWGPSPAENKFSQTHWEKSNSSGFNKDFHIYKVVWNPEGFQFYIDEELIGTLNPPIGGFWELGNFENSTKPNPWSAGTKMAPFDQQFHIIINLAVGATGYFPDEAQNIGGKPWKNHSLHPMTDFWKGRNQWEPTWNLNTDDYHFIVDYIQVFAI
ncbi:beta-1,3-glucan-binding protein-like [Dendroctonus ponderosae]|uniref:GH16 domain-containing protein n=1 Tax=Dendroctonus ponderosae TaxID=77166 RepID=U4UIR8_DENPD|nr:beta-1,3-glucan-binding protein-like [Dendroctonus ponderosae]XP_048516916.1 beta-1,3-glucan-binding protein-like [Dendroctonus ponderosae]ERL93924.1 hypothetical protein D910_11210 [Dendroctonus ponderosae]